MKMKSERPLLVDGVPQTEFETSEQHGKELISKGLAVQDDVEADTSAKLAEPATPAAPVEVDPAPPAPPAPPAARAPAKIGKSKI